MIAGIVLAGGAGSRFGGGKLLAPLEGRPLLEHALMAAATAPVLATRVVVLGCDAERVMAACDLHGARAVVCEDWREGQSASLRAGLEAARLAEGGGPEPDGVIVLLGDQPRIDARAIEAVAAALTPDDDALRASYAGRPGHPVLLASSLFASIATLRGDTGARELLRDPGVKVREVACDGLGRPDDVDTPAQLQTLRTS